ncbi:MAG: ABC transporter permease [Gemmatimonadaceae bacterium]|nr:ABC transporter permease [Gemmatimonadaceae bacterium]
MTDIAITPTVHAAKTVSRTDELKRLLTLVWTLALSDWKLRFYGSALGLAWTLVRPFALFGVVYFVFTEIVGLDKDVKNYGIYILYGLVLFTFFTEVTSNSVQALVARESLLRKMQFNPIVIPLSISVTALLNLGMTLIAVFIFSIGSGVYPMWSWFELPVIILLLTMFATGVGMLLSVLYVRYRDVAPIWEVMSQILFYASSVLYVATLVPAQYYRTFLCNPIAALFSQMRHAMVDPTAPSIVKAFGHAYYVMIPLSLIFATFILGFWFFQRESPRVAENL